MIAFLLLLSGAPTTLQWAEKVLERQKSAGILSFTLQPVQTQEAVLTTIVKNLFTAPFSRQKLNGNQIEFDIARKVAKDLKLCYDWSQSEGSQFPSSFFPMVLRRITGKIHQISNEKLCVDFILTDEVWAGEFLIFMEIFPHQAPFFIDRLWATESDPVFAALSCVLSCVSLEQFLLGFDCALREFVSWRHPGRLFGSTLRPFFDVTNGELLVGGNEIPSEIHDDRKVRPICSFFSFFCRRFDINCVFCPVLGCVFGVC